MSQTSTTKRGDALEKDIYDFFELEIKADRFIAKADCCKLRRKPKYFSRDRGSEITFDVSIEIYLPGAEDFTMVVLIECKNYTHSVPVDDVEEFFSKVQQVAAAKSKAIIASTGSFQSGTREFARSKGIGLLRYLSPDDCKWELMRSPSTFDKIDSHSGSLNIDAGLSQQDYKSDIFDLFLQSPRRVTHSLRAFFEDIFLDNALSPLHLKQIVNPKSKDFEFVPYLEKEALEKIASDIQCKLKYKNGPVPLDILCEMENIRSGLSVKLDTELPPEFLERQVLGRINFKDLQIEIYRQESINLGRDKFTLAHELSHYILEHGKYMVREWCDASDFTLEHSPSYDRTNVARMEFQANYLAACLLLPRQNVISDFKYLIGKLDLSNRGYGSLYVDNQPCNINNFEIVTRHFTKNYGVSHTAASIRLQSLGLLQDARK
jgi:Zn-dependent peptidase ImmA (M78 family)